MIIKIPLIFNFVEGCRLLFKIFITLFFCFNYIYCGFINFPSWPPGDRYLKPWIIPTPEVKFVRREKKDECLILASDGLWDVMTNEEACEIARKRILIWHKKHGDGESTTWTTGPGEGVDPAAQAAAEYLSRVALQRGSKDNISVIVIDLKGKRKFKTKT